MMRGSWLVVLAALLVVPGVAAQSTADLIWSDGQVGELKTWRILETNLEDETASHEFTGTWLDFSPYDNAIPQSLLLIEISATYTFEESSDGTWNFTLESDSFDIPGCFWHVSTRNPGGFLAGDFITYPNYQVQCATAVVLPEDSQFTIWLNRTVLTGSPNTPIDEHTTIKGDRGDFIVTSQSTNFEILTGLTGVEFLAVVGLGAALLVVGASTQHRPVKAMTGTLALLLGVLLLFFNQSAVVIVMAATLGLGAGLVFFFLALDRLKEAKASRAPRRFFE